MNRGRYPSKTIITATLALYAVGTVVAWDWPLIGTFTVEPGRYIEGFSYRLVPTAATPAAFRPVDRGEIVFRGPASHEEILPTSAVPRQTGITVYSHGNGIVSGYFTPELPAEHSVSWLEFVIWDLVTSDQPNPRLLLERRDGIPSSGIPQIRFRQHGRYVAASAITTGRLTIAIDTDTLNPIQLPWELRVLRGGVVRSQRRFVITDDLTSETDGQSFIVLDNFEAHAGINTIVLEAVRFDRSTVRRTIRFTAREPESVDGS